MDIGLCSKCLGRFCLNARDQTHISTSCVYREIYVYSNNPWLVTIEIQSNLVNPTLFVSHSFTPDSKVSGLSNQLYYMTGNYHGYVVIIT